MDSNSFEKRRVKISYGDTKLSKFTTLASCHPFTQQVDVIFPSNEGLLEALKKLELVYCKVEIKVSDIVNQAEACVNSTDGTSKLVALSLNTHEDDVWCIDPRGHLTLSLSKDTYEKLGAAGKSLPFKDHSDRYVIDIPLQKNAQTSANLAKQKAALLKWDDIRRNELGDEIGLFNVIYCLGDDTSLERPEILQCQGPQKTRVQPTQNDSFNVQIPILSLRPRPDGPSSSSRKLSNEDATEAIENWSDRVHSLFEWLGMASFGAQRLHVSDRVDPYIAIYEPPSPSHIGNLTHLRWRGLLHPHFVQQILDVVESSLQSPSNASIPFVGVTAHAITSSPVSYIPHTLSEASISTPIPSGRVPMKVPRQDGEDTWSLLLERSGAAADDARIDLNDDPMDSTPARWCLAESLGQWDTRWG